MNTRLVRFAALPALLIASTAGAQQQSRPTVARVTPYVGYITYGNFATGPLGTRVGNQPAPIFGVQVGLDVLPNVAIVGHLGYSDSNVEVGVPILGGLEIADSRALLYDGGVQVRLPGLAGDRTAIVPYVEAGVGAIRYEVSAAGLSTKSTNVAGNFGGGLDLQLNRAFGVRLMAKDYVGKFDFQEATGFGIGGSVAHNWVFGVGMNLGF